MRRSFSCVSDFQSSVILSSASVGLGCITDDVCEEKPGRSTVFPMIFTGALLLFFSAWTAFFSSLSKKSAYLILLSFVWRGMFS